MNKRYLYCLLLFWGLFASIKYSFGQTVTVTGIYCFGNDGVPVQGDYNFVSLYNGKNLYHMVNGMSILYEFGEWKIIASFTGNVLFINTNDVGLLPPATGWSVGENECNGEPPPVLIGDSQALPVSLSSFIGRLQDNDILIEWVTELEIENKEFIIERSGNGKEWLAIGLIPGNGTTNDSQVYQFLDQSPLLGIAYYRLKQIDFDGNFSFSKVISIFKKTESNAIRVIPNPVFRDMIFSLNKPCESQLNVLIFNSLGRVVMNEILSCDDNYTFELITETLPNGFYEIVVQNNRQVFFGRFVKN